MFSLILLFYWVSIREYLPFFFFSSRRRHTRCYRDWSSDVCSSDLQLGAESVLRGELRPRTVQDMRTLAEIGLTLERDYLGSSSEASEWLAFAYRMDRAAQDALTEEERGRLHARFRELERDGDGLRDRVRAAGAEMAAPGEGVLDKALESLSAQGAEASTGDGAPDGDRRPSSPGGEGALRDLMRQRGARRPR